MIKIRVKKIIFNNYKKYANQIISIYKLNQLYNKSSKQIKFLKNVHKQERCFIIGTGPSLNNTNLNLIRDEILFGVNTLFRGFNSFNIRCKFYAVTDYEVWENNYKNILELDTILLLSGGACDDFIKNYAFYKKYIKKSPYLIRSLGYMWSSKKFSKNLSKGTYNGDTIIIDICLQAAYYFGFNEIYLLGCDCDYSGMHRFDGSITENLKGGGVCGDWSKVFTSYKICKKIYEENERKIINCTVGGNLDIFPRAKLEDIV